jgi:UDP-2,3-diacylglucosamine pyrophosphatase LpxH
MITLIISDLHLGAFNSRTDLLAQLLASDFDRLILNGDTIDSLDLRRFGRWDWKVVELLQAVARHRELVVVRGNHDGRRDADGGIGSLLLLGDLLGAPVTEQCEVQTAEGPLLVVHGDQFDRTLNLTWVGDAADWFYNRIQRTSRPAARWLKHRAKHLTGVVASVTHGAAARAAAEGYVGVVTGHTHYADDEYVNGIRCLNTGCWVDWPCHAVKVADGQARLLPWGDELLAARKCIAMAQN